MPYLNAAVTPTGSWPRGLNRQLAVSQQTGSNRHPRKSIAEFGGSPGLRDPSALESALAAAEHRHFYDSSDLATCAATYAFHISQAHAFVDGNKRVAAAVAEVFLEINGALLTLTNNQIVDLFLRIARWRSIA
jgi:death-on-curing protein